MRFLLGGLEVVGEVQFGTSLSTIGLTLLDVTVRLSTISGGSPIQSDASGLA